MVQTFIKAQWWGIKGRNKGRRRSSVYYSFAKYITG